MTVASRHAAMDENDSDGPEERGATVANRGGLAALLALLPGRQRELINLLSRGGLTHRQAARLMGVSAGTISRQMARLRLRLRHPVVEALQASPHSLNPTLRQIAIDYFLLGLSGSRLARQRDLSRHAIALLLSQIRGWARATLRSRRDPGKQGDASDDPLA